MANKTLWAPESEVILLAGELDNAADLDIVVDAADYDNATDGFQFADFLLFVTFDAQASAGAIVELHIFYRLDGTNYGDGEAGDVGDPQPSGNSLHGVFIIGAQTIVYQQLLMVPLSPRKFKVAVRIVAGQGLTANSHTLKMYPFNPELQ